MRAVQASDDGDGEVVLVMGIPGAGKSRVAAEYVARGYLRINRDERGGSLRDAADALDEQLSAGARRVVLDNTYLTRASRSYVIEAATRHGRSDLLRVARHAARPGAGQPRRAAARAVRLAPDARRAARVGAASAGRAGADLADAGRARARAAVDRRGAGGRGAAAVRARRACVRRRAPASSLRQPCWRSLDWTSALDDGDRAAPHLVFDWRPDGESGGARRTRSPASPARCRARSRPRSVRTAPARRHAGVARRFRGFCSRSPGRTTSTRRARC